MFLGGFAAGSVDAITSEAFLDAFVAGSTYAEELTAINNAISAGVGVGILTGETAGSAASYGLIYAETKAGIIGASPALIVEQGQTFVSQMLISTATDAPTLIVDGGSLTLLDNFVSGNLAGSQPLIQVNGGKLVLGAADGTHPDAFGAYGSVPFLQVAGTGMVIVEPGVLFAQIDSNLDFHPAGATTTQVVSSSPAALPGQKVTFTATVTTGDAPASDGSVEFFDDTTGNYLGMVPVTSGTAAIQVTFNAITAAGDAIYRAARRCRSPRWRCAGQSR